METFLEREKILRISIEFPNFFTCGSNDFEVVNVYPERCNFYQKLLHVSLILRAFSLFSDEKCQNVRKSRIQTRNYKKDSNKNDVPYVYKMINVRLCDAIFQMLSSIINLVLWLFCSMCKIQIIISRFYPLILDLGQRERKI